jgi:uncharacterized protein (TIRG00374 family)
MNSHQKLDLKKAKKFRWIFWLLIIAFIWFIVTKQTEIKKLVHVFSQGKWEWILTALLVQILYYVFYALMLRSAFSAVETQWQFLEILPLTVIAVFINTVTPTAGSAGIALFSRDATRRGRSGVKATSGNLLATVIEFLAFLLVLVIGMVYLFFQHDLKIYEIIAAVVLVLYIGIQTAVLLLGLWQPALLRKSLNFVQRFIKLISTKFKHHSLLKDIWATKTAEEFTTAAVAIGRHKNRLVQTFGIALGMQALNIACLCALFLAFKHPIKFGALVAGYAVGFLFMNISPLPQGIGIVEGVMTLVYTSLDVPSEVALIITLAFRGLTIWLPFTVGFILLRLAKKNL